MSQTPFKLDVTREQWEGLPFEAEVCSQPQSNAPLTKADFYRMTEGYPDWAWQLFQRCGHQPNYVLQEEAFRLAQQHKARPVLTRTKGLLAS